MAIHDCHKFSATIAAASEALSSWFLKKTEYVVHFFVEPNQTCPTPTKTDICATVETPYIGDGHPTFNRNPYNGYINPYYKVDDHPYHRKTMRVVRPQHIWSPKICGLCRPWKLKVFIEWFLCIEIGRWLGDPKGV